jgi:hypothetical protein
MTRDDEGYERSLTTDYTRRIDRQHRNFDFNCQQGKALIEISTASF